MSDTDGESGNTIVELQSSAIKRLKKIRGTLKAKLTLFNKNISKINLQSLTAEQIIDLRLRTDRIKKSFEEFDSVQTEIETLSSDVEDELSNRESYENTYYECVAKAEAGLSKSGKVGLPGLASRQSTASSEPVLDSIKYPDIPLPEFSGDISRWIEFRDTFDALINKGALRQIQKYKYLRSCLKGGALEVVGALEYSEESYSIAWQLLCERYNNPRLLVNNHLRALLHISEVPNTPSGLRGLVDNISKHLRTLKGLNVSTEDWDVLIIFFLSSKLDKNILKKWEERSNSKDLPTLQEFKSFLRNRADLMETLNSGSDPEAPGLSSLGAGTSRATNWRTCNVATLHPATNAQSVGTPAPHNQCPVCDQRHFITQCGKFLAMNVGDRNKMVRRLKLCTNCLRGSHSMPTCRATTCRTCRGKHHSLLHYTNVGSASSNSPSTMHNPPAVETTTPRVHNQQIINTAVTNSEQSTQPKSVLLSTAQIKAFDKNNKAHTLRALLDSGAQSNFITQEAFDKLQLGKSEIDMEVIGFNGIQTNINHFCTVKIESKVENYNTKISCLIVPTLCELPHHNNNDIQNIKLPSGLKLADVRFYEPGRIDMIIGAELFYNLICTGQRKLGEGQPILQQTRLGWVISGAVKAPVSRTVHCNFIINSQMNRLWENDSLSKPKVEDCELAECERVFNRHSRAVEGNFVVELPLKMPVESLGSSRNIAYKRMRTLEKKFERDPVYKEMYVDFMRKFKSNGCMKEQTDRDTSARVYLPHHAVVNMQKTSTPLRVVIDASCPTSTGISLNDIQYKGAIMQDDLTDIIIRFRMHQYVVSADIEKMYTKIHVTPHQQGLQCIVWRENPQDALKTYKLTTLSFGLRCAPYIATRCLKEIANQNKHRFPEAAMALANDFLMDDLLYGRGSKEEVIQTVIQVEQLLQESGFTLRKWKSNSPEILKSVSRTTQTHTNTVTEIGNTTHKVLGLAWSDLDDELLYPSELDPVPRVLSKRKVLSSASSVFDPLGLLGPIIITAKMYVQRLVILKLDWDETLSAELHLEWSQIWNQMNNIKKIKIKRNVVIRNSVSIELHGFSDSSKGAYGAAVYVRSVDQEGNIFTSLLTAKSRIAGRETIPRLELQAALLLARLVKKLKTILRHKIDKINLWSDSTVALAWINTEPHKLNCYVSNRVKEIREITDKSHWHWVSTNDNPADLLSRGTPAENLIHNTLWWQGPKWLSKPNTEWPKEVLPHNTTQLPEMKSEKPIKVCNLVTTNSGNQVLETLIGRYNTDTQLIRTLAYVKRFIHNIKYPNNKLVERLSVEELNKSLNHLIKYVQVQTMEKEYDLLSRNKSISPRSTINSLDPFIQDGLIRVGGRLKLSECPQDKKHPIILPQNNTLTKLIMQSQHRRLLHAGAQLLLSTMRERFWPIHGKSLANKVIKDCVICFRAKPVTTSPIMASLPRERVTPAPPFDTTGVDYAGPFNVRDRRGRGCRFSKCWVALFVCFSTKAVHIELVSSLETVAFLAALRRFIARRGKPSQLVSDNGTTFHGADNEIKRLYKYLRDNSSEIIDLCTNEGITWKFNPPYSPHIGGLFEAAVKACKLHLKRVLGNAMLTFEEFSTVLTQIEGILNSRPLCPIPKSDTDNFPILTPAHFLIGRSLTALPDYDCQNTPSNKLKLHQQFQQIQHDFWRRWSRDYLTLMQERVKWRSTKSSSLTADSLVLIRDEQLPPTRWRLGRILELHRGPDNIARVASIKTATGIIKRAFNNICPLPIKNED